MAKCDCGYCRVCVEYQDKPMSASRALLSLDLPTEEVTRRHRQYIEEIQPFVEMQVKILNLQPVRYIQQGDHWLNGVLWQPGSKELYENLAECIEATRRKIFQER